MTRRVCMGCGRAEDETMVDGVCIACRTPAPGEGSPFDPGDPLQILASLFDLDGQLEELRSLPVVDDGGEMPWR